MAIKDMLFKVEWNEEAYGKTEPRIVTMSEFKADGIEGNWGIDGDRYCKKCYDYVEPKTIS